MLQFTTSQNSKRSGIISILIALPVISLTGLFGKFIQHSPLLIVQARTVFAFCTLFFLLLILQNRNIRNVRREKIIFETRQEWLWLFLNGVVLALHWLTFYKSIQISTVSICLISFAGYPLFTTFLEPLIFREQFRRRNIFAVFVVIIGLLLMATSGTGNADSLSSGRVLEGMLWGLASGFAMAVLTLLNRGHVKTHSPLLLTCWQNGFAALVLLPFSWSESWILSEKDWRLLLLLGVVCTAGGHYFLINALRHIQAQFVSLLVAGLEPVLAIILAIFLLGEIPPLQIVFGGILIVGTTAYMIQRSE